MFSTWRYGRHHFTQRTKFRYRGAKNSGYRAEKMRSSGVDTLTKINHPQFSSRCVCSSSFRFPVSDRRMDVPIVGKSELGGKYEAGIRRRRRRHLDCRHWQRRRKRRKGGDGGGGGGGKLTECWCVGNGGCVIAVATLAPPLYPYGVLLTTTTTTTIYLLHISKWIILLH
ncbi:YTH domain-containing protein 1-like isoform X2 [Vespula squamosa]|uniref:YTH domain-containing protein 1-like isoform X2 n=1 Tax=Vespula squamosa TaxID=30214 RepID=A0ABD2AJ09_VESSQ